MSLNKGLKYRKDIDGLRAISVLIVVLFHADFEIFSGGYLGVDIFFVISGYLITSILINDLENSSFSIFNFYNRRARRILPALFTVMIVCIPFGWFLMFPYQLKDFFQSLIAVSIFISNFLFWKETNYFSPLVEEKPLLHTWSLSVEEQYYLFFPIMLFYLWKYQKENIKYIISFLIIISLAYAEISWRSQPVANFYLLPGRVWEIFFGSLSAFFLHKKNIKDNNILSSIGVILILISLFFFDKYTPFPSIYTLAPVIGCVLIIIFGGQKTIVNKVLSQDFLVKIGLISYSLYLWHWPILSFAKIWKGEKLELILVILLVSLSFLLAFFSWKYIEKPFRNKNLKIFTQKKIFIYSFISIVFFIVIGTTGHLNNGFQNRFKTPEFVKNNYHELAERKNNYCFFNLTETDIKKVGDQGLYCFLNNFVDKKKNILLYGDSHAAQWEPFLKIFAETNKYSINSITTNFCFPSIGSKFTAPKNHVSIKQCKINRNHVKNEINENKIIFLGGAWHSIQNKNYTQSVINFIEYKIRRNNKVVIFDIPPQFTRSSVDNIIYKNKGELIFREINEKYGRAFWDVIQKKYSQNPNIFLLERKDLFKKDYITEDNYPYSLDGSHISIYGSTKSFSFFSKSNTYKRLVEFINEYL